MKKKRIHKKDPDEFFQESQREQILALMDHIGGDGHTVWLPSVLDAFPAPLKSRFTEILKSKKGNYKETIFKDGKAVSTVTAVYGLSVHLGICRDLNIECGSFMGRGFQAQACCSAIRKHFNYEKPSASPAIQDGQTETPTTPQ